MARILIINTGGTISMVASERGYVPDGARFRTMLEGMELLKADPMPEWDLIETSPLLDSSNMTVLEWNHIGSLVAENYHAYDGFVILHGTDTMAYTASALSFMLEHLNKPVILTGSQIPFGQIRSDGRDNLINSLLIAAEGKVKEVCIFFGSKLLRGNRATKYSADEMIAFVSPNYPQLAEAGISVSYNESAFLNDDGQEFHLQVLEEVPIGVIKVFPGIQFSLFDQIMTEKLKGIVIETFGAGNIPNGGDALLPIVKKAMEHGSIITVCSQCLQGTVSLGTYEASSALAEAGAVSGRDITTEAAVAKLYYLFSKGYTADHIKQLMETSICGEVSDK